MMNTVLKTSHFQLVLFFALAHPALGEACKDGSVGAVKQLLIDRWAFERLWFKDSAQESIPVSALTKTPTIVLGLDGFAICSGEASACWIDTLIDGRIGLPTEKLALQSGESFNQIIQRAKDRLTSAYPNTALVPVGDNRTTTKGTRKTEAFRSGKLSIEVPASAPMGNVSTPLLQCELEIVHSALVPFSPTDSRILAPDDYFLGIVRKFLASSTELPGPLSVTVPFGPRSILTVFILVKNGPRELVFRLIQFSKSDVRVVEQLTPRSDPRMFAKVKSTIEAFPHQELRIRP
jgi:hypothetical protein